VNCLILTVLEMTGWVTPSCTTVTSMVTVLDVLPFGIWKTP
jgi:hypothetical protein